MNQDAKAQRREEATWLAFGGFLGEEAHGPAELNEQAPADMTPRVLAPADRDIITWKGGKSVAGQLSAGDWVSRADYATNGPAIVRMKCNN